MLWRLRSKNRAGGSMTGSWEKPLARAVTTALSNIDLVFCQGAPCRFADLSKEIIDLVSR